ncbi:MAG: hypothetical protein WBB28_08600 [Crinalium sp.]
MPRGAKGKRSTAKLNLSLENSYKNTEIDELSSHISDSLNKLKKSVKKLEKQWIAPIGVSLHTYTVKREKPHSEGEVFREYTYAKLKADEAIFLSSEGEAKISQCHLGKTFEEEYQIASKGIYLRNKITHATRLLREAEELIASALKEME